MKNTDYEIESFYLKKNILVTGASGFIASWLINELISLNTTIYALSKGYSNSFKIINAKTAALFAAAARIGACISNKNRKEKGV